jgi:hypothetical protein
MITTQTQLTATEFDMNTELQTQSTATELNLLWDQTQAAGFEFAERTKDFLSSAVELGHRLTAAKAEVNEANGGPGSWWTWLAENCPQIDPKLAQSYMRISRHFALGEPLPEGIQTLKAALALVAKSEDEASEAETEKQVSLFSDGTVFKPTWVGRIFDTFFHRSSKIPSSGWTEDMRRDLKDRLTALQTLAARVGVQS